MSAILIGTTSWTDRTLIESGLFYPPGVSTAEARLRYYASQFSIVEVDSSYYGLPSERNANLWLRRTPKGFVFDVKAFRLFTQHQTPLDALPRDIRKGLGEIEKEKVYHRDMPEDMVDELWERFRSALAPLRRAGKLGVVLFQFPPWFVYRPSSLDYIASCAEKMKGDRLAIEFRNKSWFSEKRWQDTLEFERGHRLVHVVVDEPQGFAGSVPAVWEATSPEAAVVRLHGRNRATWQSPGLTAAERFNYLYSDDELRELVEPVRSLAAHAKAVHVLFNNCYRNYAQANAATLKRMLRV